MRGLPPMPDEVLEFELTGDVNGSTFHIVQHFLAVGVIGWGVLEFGEFISGWAAFALTHLLNILPTPAGFSACRLTRYGSVPFRYEQELPTNAGVHGQCDPLNSALCVTWQAFGVGFSSRSHNRLPLVSDAVNLDKRTLHPDFKALYDLELAQYLLEANSVVVGSFASPQMTVVSRSQAGSPRAVAAFAPVVAGYAAPDVGTLRRRIRARR